MKTLKQGIFYLLFSTLAIGSFSSCYKANKIICPPCALYPTIIPHIQFRVVDKTTGEDLFFGDAAKYKISQIQTFHYTNGYFDTLRLRVDSINHTFFMGISQIHTPDTVTMQIANLSKDTFVFNTEAVGICCPKLVLNNVTLNNNIIYTLSSGPDVVVIEK